MTMTNWVRRNGTVSEFDGERFLRDKVDAVRDEWARWEDTVPFCSKSVRATLHPDAPAVLELSIARTRVLDYL